MTHELKSEQSLKTIALVNANGNITIKQGKNIVSLDSKQFYQLITHFNLRSMQKTA